MAKIFDTLRNGPAELQELAILVLKTHYKTKKTLLPSANKNIDFYLFKLNKELILKNQKTILQELEMLIKLFEYIVYFNERFPENKKSVLKHILKEIKDYEIRVNLVHKENIDRLKLQNKKSFVMITVTFKFITNLSKGIERLVDVRTAVKNSCREFLRYRGKESKNLVILEISKNGLLHFHMYFYEELSEEEIEKLQKNLIRKIKKLGNVKDFDVKAQSMDLNYDNYSSPFNNIFNKMKGDVRARQIIYYLFIKMFGRRKFLTHSRIDISFYKLKTIMRLFSKGGVFNVIKISYFKLVEMIKEKSNLIQIKIYNDPYFICLYDFVMNELKFANIVSRIKVNNTILRLM